MASYSPKLLLIGATGYIGGSVLTQLLRSEHVSLKDKPITVLVRGQDKADALTSTLGGHVKPLVVPSFDDTDTLTEVASEHDIIINAGTTAEVAAPSALLKGLAQRKK
ncbi:hypothetical protein LTS18_008170, partial [Coniosporium uncinatum]